MQQIVRESQPVVELDEKVGLIIQLTQGRLIQPRPDSIAPLPSWRVEAEVLYAVTPVWAIALIVACIATLICLSLRFLQLQAFPDFLKQVKLLED